MFTVAIQSRFAYFLLLFKVSTPAPTSRLMVEYSPYNQGSQIIPRTWKLVIYLKIDGILFSWVGYATQILWPNGDNKDLQHRTPIDNSSMRTDKFIVGKNDYKIITKFRLFKFHMMKFSSTSSQFGQGCINLEWKWKLKCSIL